MNDAAPGGAMDQDIQQLGLADACLATHDESSTASRSGALEEIVESLDLPAAPEKSPAITAARHLSTEVDRVEVPAAVMPGRAERRRSGASAVGARTLRCVQFSWQAGTVAMARAFRVRRDRHRRQAARCPVPAQAPGPEDGVGFSLLDEVDVLGVESPVQDEQGDRQMKARVVVPE